MEFLNFNSVETLPGFEARAAFTVNSATVFREDVDIVPIIIDETLSYVPWGGDNNMPFDILQLIEDDETLSTCQMFNAEVCFGSGLRYDTCLASAAVKSEVEDFFLDNDIASYYLGVCQDFKHFGFAVSVIILSRDGTKIVRLLRKEACYCRFAPAGKDGRITRLLYANWRKCIASRSDIEVIELLDAAAPWRDLQDRLAKNTTCRKFAVVSRIPTPDSTYYPIPYYCCPVKLLETIKIRAEYLAWYSALVVTFAFSRVTTITMNKGTHFSGQPMYGQLIDLLDKDEILKFSRAHHGERYVKHFDAFQHLTVMLYAVIRRFDSLREISDSMFPESRKLAHLGISTMPRRSTLSDANARRSEKVFEDTYRSLYARYKDLLSSDSRKRQVPSWLKRLQIIDSTTITLFSNLLFKGVGRHPKSGKKKGGIKVHTNIHANEGVPSDIRFTSAATNDSFMLKPTNYNDGDIIAMDRAYIDYSKFEELTSRSVIYVTKMKKNLVYDVHSDMMYMTPEGLMEHRVQFVEFKKRVKDGEDIRHKARIITYVDLNKKKPKLISLLTNDMEMEVEEIIAIYRKRWEIELLFKQLKQNFPLRYFYGESSNAIKVQIWVTLIANLLLMVIQKRIKRTWSFSGLATMIRIMLMYYVNCYTFLEDPERDWAKMVQNAKETPPEPSLFD